jgi:hypothetical protein
MAGTWLKCPISRLDKRPYIVIDEQILVPNRIDFSDCYLSRDYAAFEHFMMRNLERLGVKHDFDKSVNEVCLEFFCDIIKISSVSRVRQPDYPYGKTRNVIDNEQIN